MVKNQLSKRIRSSYRIMFTWAQLSSWMSAANAVFQPAKQCKSYSGDAHSSGLDKVCLRAE